MQEPYKVVFDSGHQPMVFEGWMIPLFILPIVGLLFVITPQTIVDRILPRGPKGMAGKLFAWFFFLFTGFIAGTWLMGYEGQLTTLKSAEKTGHISVVDGCLKYFHAMPQEGHDVEKIEVDGHIFTYSDYISTPAFHITESHGGPIHADSKVRLVFSGQDIVRVEVQQKACPRAQDFPK